MRYADSILKIITMSTEHLTAEQIFLTLKESYPSVVLATVYNNLNSLYSQGKIRKISVDGCTDRYDKNTRHDHLVCRNCGKLYDINLPDITAEIEKSTGFSIDGYDLKVNFICPQCREKHTSHR